jgi:hypothetical protein
VRNAIEGQAAPSIAVPRPRARVTKIRTRSGRDRVCGTATDISH